MGHLQDSTSIPCPPDHNTATRCTQCREMEGKWSTKPRNIQNPPQLLSLHPFLMNRGFFSSRKDKDSSASRQHQPFLENVLFCPFVIFQDKKTWTCWIFFRASNQQFQTTCSKPKDHSINNSSFFDLKLLTRKAPAFTTFWKQQLHEFHEALCTRQATERGSIKAWQKQSWNIWSSWKMGSCNKVIRR